MQFVNYSYSGARWIEASNIPHSDVLNNIFWNNCTEGGRIWELPDMMSVLGGEEGHGKADVVREVEGILKHKSDSNADKGGGGQ